jgi:hypothetical protein
LIYSSADVTPDTAAMGKQEPEPVIAEVEWKLMVILAIDVGQT